MPNITPEESNIIKSRVYELTHKLFNNKDSNLFIDFQTINKYRHELFDLHKLSNRISNYIIKTIHNNIVIVENKYPSYSSIADRFFHLNELKSVITNKNLSVYEQNLLKHELNIDKINEELNFLHNTFCNHVYVDFSADFNNDNSTYDDYIMDDFEIQQILKKYSLSSNA